MPLPLTPDQIAYFDNLTTVFQAFRQAWKDALKVQNNVVTATISEGTAALVALQLATQALAVVLAPSSTSPDPVLYGKQIIAIVPQATLPFLQ